MKDDSAVRVGLVVVYGVAVAVSLFVGFGVAMGFPEISQWFRPLFLPVLPAVLVVKLLVFAKWDLYRGRRISFRDAFASAWVCTLVLFVLFFVASNLLKDRFSSADYRQSTFLWDFVATVLLTWFIQKAVAATPGEKTDTPPADEEDKDKPSSTSP